MFSELIMVLVQGIWLHVEVPTPCLLNIKEIFEEKYTICIGIKIYGRKNYDEHLNWEKQTIHQQKLCLTWKG